MGGGKQGFDFGAEEGLVASTVIDVSHTKLSRDDLEIVLLQQPTAYNPPMVPVTPEDLAQELGGPDNVARPAIVAVLPEFHLPVRSAAVDLMAYVTALRKRGWTGALVAGIELCSQEELRTAVDGTFPEARYARISADHPKELVNATAVVTWSKRRVDLTIQFKLTPSAGQFQPAREENLTEGEEIFLFSSSEFSFAVLTCSDMITRRRGSRMSALQQIEFEWILGRSATPLDLLVSPMANEGMDDERFMRAIDRVFDDNRDAPRHHLLAMVNASDAGGGSRLLYSKHRVLRPTDKTPRGHVKLAAHAHGVQLGTGPTAVRFTASHPQDHPYGLQHRVLLTAPVGDTLLTVLPRQQEPPLRYQGRAGGSSIRQQTRGYRCCYRVGRRGTKRVATHGDRAQAKEHR